MIVEIPKVRWSQVGGYRELKARIEEFLLIPWKNRQEARRFGVRVPKGAVLYGPPGTGKTWIAKAAANEAKVKVILVRGSTLKSKWYGEYEQNIARTFDVARRAAPVILILDEVESIASTRTGVLGESSKADLGGLNEMLSKLDGVEEIHDVFLICTTNKPEIVDQAFLRSGRIEHHFYVGKPDYQARLEIFKIHLADVKIPLAQDVNVEELTKLSDGMVGADIERIVRSASLKAFCEYVNDGCNSEPRLGMQHFLRSLEDAKSGLRFEKREDN
jgi:transitional endoplasmic reticulum ATPase